MIKLLNAGFERLRKNKIFWLLITFTIGLALILIFTQYSDMKEYNEVKKIEQLILNYSMMMGIVIAIFTSLFLGVEYSDGTIRNKISIGHKRINIYLSNLIIIAITSLFSYILFMLLISIIGIPLFGKITISISTLLSLIGCGLLMVISLSSIFTFIAMMISNKTITAIVSIMLAFGLMFGALICLLNLDRQEYVQQGSLVNEEIKYEEVKNPKYPSEKERKIYQTLLDVNPAGQGFQIAGRIANVKILPFYSLGIVVIFTGIGIMLFNKKELK